MQIEIDPTGTAQALDEILSRLSATGEPKAFLVIAGDANGFSPEELNPVLARCELPVFGGTFPAILSGQAKYDRGTIVVGLDYDVSVQLVEGLSEPAVDFEEALDDIEDLNNSAKTAIVLIDGLATRIDAFVAGLFDVYGFDLNYVGGGAGSLSMERRPCVFTNSGYVSDAAVVGLLPVYSGVGVSHGWEPIAGPFSVTEVERNVVETLDWKPALHVYRDVVERHSGRRLTDDNYFDIAKFYPFGINKVADERIVRDPLSANSDGSMVCVGELHQNTFVDIMNGVPDRLIAAARHARVLASSTMPSDTTAELMFVMDCISRTLCLESRFAEEIDAIYDAATRREETVPLVGALSLGEIANSGRDYLEFLNKTAVVAELGGVDGEP